MSSNIFGYNGSSVGGFDASSALKNYVTLTTGQTITGQKLFTAPLTTSDVEVDGELTIQDPVNLDTSILLQNDNKTQLFNTSVSGSLELFHKDAGSLDKKTLEVSTLGSIFNTKTVRVNSEDQPDVDDTFLLLDAYSANDAYNPVVEFKDAVISASNLDPLGPDANLVLTVEDSINTGIRISTEQVMAGTGGTQKNPSTALRIVPGTITLGAGSTSSSSFAPTSYLSVIQGQTPLSLGPIPGSTDSTSKIATTHFTQNAIQHSLSTLPPTVQSTVWNNVESGGVHNYYMAIPTATVRSILFIKSSYVSIFLFLNVRLPDAFQCAGKEIVLRWTFSPEYSIYWAAMSYNGVTPQLLGGSATSSTSQLILSEKYSATFISDGMYWCLTSTI